MTFIIYGSDISTNVHLIPFYYFPKDSECVFFFFFPNWHSSGHFAVKITKQKEKCSMSLDLESNNAGASFSSTTSGPVHLESGPIS